MSGDHHKRRTVRIAGREITFIVGFGVLVLAVVGLAAGVVGRSAAQQQTLSESGRATRALALLRGRDYALPQDVQDIVPDILRHRLVLSYDALADDVPADHIVARIMASVPIPSVASRQGASPNGHSPNGQPAPTSGVPAGMAGPFDTHAPHQQPTMWPGQQ